MDIDLLPCGCVVTDADRTILRMNQYYGVHFDPARRATEGVKIEQILSRASQIFCESYVVPTVMKETVCKEIQLSLVSADRAPIPVIANVSRLPDGGLIWAFIEAENRNRLYDELEAARDVLEDQREQLERLSRTDPLTGIQNRRSFDEDLARMFAEADRTDASVSVLIMDADHFKSINDVHGHPVGDAALVQLASALTAVCRNSDSVARLGGDEFSCGLNNTNSEEALALCDRIHRAVADVSVGDRAITVSIGISGRTKDRPIGCQAALLEADKALYQAKQSGRNTTAIWQPCQPLPEHRPLTTLRPRPRDNDLPVRHMP